MDDKQVAKEMLKDFMKEYPSEKRPKQCPFTVALDYKLSRHHELCAVVFPGWGRKYLEKWRTASRSRQSAYAYCPCAKMSQSYVRRKARAFVAKK